MVTKKNEGRRSEGRGLTFSSSPGIKLIKSDYLDGCKKLQYGGRSRTTFPALTTTMKTTAGLKRPREGELFVLLIRLGGPL